MTHGFPPWLRCLIGVIAAIVFHGSAAWAQKELSIVALVNDKPISAYDVLQRLRFVSATSGTQPTEAMRKKVLNDLVNESLQVQEAKKMNIAIGKDAIDSALNKIAKRNGMTGEQMGKALAQLGINDATFRDRMTAILSWRQVIRQKFSRQVRVSATQIERAMKDQVSGQVEKTEFQLQRVSLKVPHGADQRTITSRLVEAEQLRRKFNSCKSISDLVKNIDDASVQSLGRKTADQIAQPSRALILNASTGQLTPASITAASVELYAVCGRRAIKGGDPQKRRAVENKLRQQEFGRVSQSYLRDLRQDAYIEYR